ncbi:MAG: hypothetical protein ACR2P5_07195 [Gammaproteobacteria bacterium]
MRGIIRFIKQLSPSSVKRRRGIALWKQNGSPVPPPHAVKYITIKHYAQKFSLRVLVETGTFRGRMIRWAKNDFAKIYSIEMSAALHGEAKRKFARYPHITLIQGDSGVEIAPLVKELTRPALFWLDSHFSGGNTARGEKDTPIMEELQHVLNAPNAGHVILIDDARCFGSDPTYPVIAELKDFVHAKNPNAVFTVRRDIIIIEPAQTAGRECV